MRLVVTFFSTFFLVLLFGLLDFTSGLLLVYFITLLGFVTLLFLFNYILLFLLTSLFWGIYRFIFFVIFFLLLCSLHHFLLGRGGEVSYRISFFPYTFSLFFSNFLCWSRSHSTPYRANKGKTGYCIKVLFFLVRVSFFRTNCRPVQRYLPVLSLSGQQEQGKDDFFLVFFFFFLLFLSRVYEGILSLLTQAMDFQHANWPFKNSFKSTQKEPRTFQCLAICFLRVPVCLFLFPGRPEHLSFSRELQYTFPIESNPLYGNRLSSVCVALWWADSHRCFVLDPPFP